MRNSTRKKRTQKATRTGASRSVFTILLLAVSLLPLWAEEKSKAEYALIMGTVFRPPGFSLPGATVVLTPEQKESGGKKFKKQTTQSDARGEYAFRVPAVPMKYVIRVQREGFADQEKPVSVEGAQHREVPFELQPRPKE
jgi:hypothetical protein